MKRTPPSEGIGGFEVETSFCCHIPAVESMIRWRFRNKPPRSRESNWPAIDGAGMGSAERVDQLDARPSPLLKATIAGRAAYGLRDEANTRVVTDIFIGSPVMQPGSR